jgi:phosphoglycolate phosphatase
VNDSRFALVLLDLDGTLLDTRLDLVASTNHVRASFGLAPLEAETIQHLVGRGARVLVERALGAERSELHDEGLRRFLAHYGEHCLDHTRPYPGMIGALDEVATAGVRLAVLTNKPQGLSRQILDGLDLSPRFLAVVGGDTFPERKPHPRGAEYLRCLGAVEREATLLVGDSSVDVDTGRAAQVAVCGVLWGFDAESVTAARPDFVARDAPELVRIIQRGAP